MSVFPIGFWNYRHVSETAVSDAADWEDCGMNLVIGPWYHPDRDKKEDLLAILDACSRRNIRVIVADARAHWKGAACDEAAYRARFAAALADFGEHPAVFGFHVGDEPRAEDRQDCAAACRIQLKMAPKLTPFINFFPWHEKINSLLDTRDYGQWLKQFAAESGDRLLCYDCYAQMNPGEAGIDLYFRNLKIFTEAAKAAGRPLWTTLLSVGHFLYRCPSEDDFRWQINTAAASGCKGLLWFFFYEMVPPSINYRDPPVDELNEKTDTYYTLRRTVRRFQSQFGEILSRLTLDRIYHMGKTYGGYDAFIEDADPLVHTLCAKNSTPLLLSVFRDGAGAEYCCVVNLSQTQSTFFEMEVNGEDIRAYRYEYGGTQQLVDVQQDASYHADDGSITIGSWLAPGQMELYQIGQAQ